MSTVIQLKKRLNKLLEVVDNLELTRQVEILMFLDKIVEIDKDILLIVDKANGRVKIKAMSLFGRGLLEKCVYPASIPINNYESTLASLLQHGLKVGTI